MLFELNLRRLDNTKLAEITEKELEKKELVLDKYSGSNNNSSFGPFNIKFDKQEYSSGRYILEASVKSLDGVDKGKRLDRKIQLIFVNIEPPVGGGF